MADIAVFSPQVALGIIAFLLSLLPAGFFIWLWYLRHHHRSVKPGAVASAFALGLASVPLAFLLEDQADRNWERFFPATSHYFEGPILPLQNWWDILFPAIGTFLVVAVVEEGIRYLIMRVWFKRSKKVDQVFDGLVIGVAIGLGFATLENTLYFRSLFTEGSYNALVFVFFLRFMISTLAHISFGGLMGALIARGVFSLYTSRTYFLAAFFIPWFVHGLFDLLLGINFGLYAVLILVPPLLVLVYWTQRRDFFIIHRRNGNFLEQEEAPQSREVQAVQQVLKTMDSPWNKDAPWLSRSTSYRKVLDAMKKS
ncbi:MAG: PrsW family intramembrane metalloprotease [Candidatus Andersenbacteria bacterium]